MSLVEGGRCRTTLLMARSPFAGGSKATILGSGTKDSAAAQVTKAVSVMNQYVMGEPDDVNDKSSDGCVGARGGLGMQGPFVPQQSCLLYTSRCV